jgi:hypothetical protein
MQTTVARKQTFSVSHGYSRRYERKYYSVDIVFSIDGRIFQGCLKNISLGGAFIMTKHAEQLCEGDVVTLSIPFTNGGRHVKMTGCIKWKNSTGFAVVLSKI